MKKIKKPKIVRNKDKHNLEWKKVRLGVEIREDLRDKFRDAVEENGDNMTSVLTEYMQYYVKETYRQRKKAEQSEE